MKPSFSCLVNVICVCLGIVVSNIYCVVFVLCLVCPMLPVSLDCPFLIAPLVFSNIYSLLQGTIPPKDPSSDFFLGRIKYKCTWLCLNMERKWVPLSCMKNVMILCYRVPSHQKTRPQIFF
jgi:hypothetical protein